MLQIILSEILDVPTSIETGLPDVVDDFYDPDNRIEYGLNTNWPALERGSRAGDCRDLPKFDADGNYLSCAHFIPEIWNSELDDHKELVQTKTIEPSMGLGVVGQESW